MSPEDYLAGLKPAVKQGGSLLVENEVKLPSHPLNREEIEGIVEPPGQKELQSLLK